LTLYYNIAKDCWPRRKEVSAFPILAAAEVQSCCWRRGYRSGNSSAATQQNAAREGFADRFELLTGDMTELPFDDDSNARNVAVSP
jgi:hypothetical protein